MPKTSCSGAHGDRPGQSREMLFKQRNRVFPSFQAYTDLEGCFVMSIVATRGLTRQVPGTSWFPQLQNLGQLLTLV